MNTNLSNKHHASSARLRMLTLFGVAVCVAMLLSVSTAFAGDWGGGDPPPSQVTTGTISGYVTNPSGAPIAGVEISVYREQHPGWDDWQVVPQNGDTDAQGFYRIKDLPAASYHIFFHDMQNEYLSRTWGGSGAVVGEEAVPVEVLVGQVTSGINVVLPVAGRVTGRVTNASGQPLANIRVIGYRWEMLSSGTGSWTSSDLGGVQCYSDQNGDYELRGLETGSYRLWFSDSTSGSGRTYLARYLGGLTDIGDWNDVPNYDVSVSQGLTTANVDQVLPRGGRIKGRVLDAHTGVRPFQGPAIRIEALQGGNPMGGQTIYSTTGEFDFGALETGNYKLRVYSSPMSFYRDYFYFDQANLAGATLVPVVAGADSTVSDIGLTYVSAVEGRVTDPTGAPLFVVQVSAQYWSGTTWVTEETAYTDARGVYLMEGLTSGRSYRFKFEDALGGRATRYNGGAQTIEAAPDVTFVTGQSNLNVDAVLSVAVGPFPTVLTLNAPTFRFSGSTTLSGTLVSRGAGLAGVAVLVERSADGGVTWPDIATVTTGADGAWALLYSPSATWERNQKIRVSYAGAGTYVASSTTADLLATVYLSTPKKSVSSPKAKRSFTVYGYIKPKFKAGTYPVRAYFYKLQADGSYAFVKSVSLKASNSSSYTKVSRSVKLSSKGRYRVDFRFSGGSKSYKGYRFAATLSPSHYFKVK